MAGFTVSPEFLAKLCQDLKGCGDELDQGLRALKGASRAGLGYDFREDAGRHLRDTWDYGLGTVRESVTVLVEGLERIQRELRRHRAEHHQGHDPAGRLMADRQSAAWHDLILRSGENVSAVVLFEKVENTGRGSKTWSYTLVPRSPAVDPPGGDLEQDSHRFKPGDVITVRVDPAGRAAPKLPGEADSPAAFLGFLGLNAAIDAVVLWATRKPRPPRRPARPAGASPSGASAPGSGSAA
ncbi:hypothetical protein [Kitasatospora sp. NPDC086791]|uniref:hypothetical protein n=1 Tax=Kitasatospora sp. NPDC086791 TaxID=3155178 RepID=UPI003414E139